MSVFYLLLLQAAGDEMGYNQELKYADMKVGEKVPVVYDSTNPNKAYKDTIWGIWKMPILIFLFQIASFVVCLTKPDAGDRWT